MSRSIRWPVCHDLEVGSHVVRYEPHTQKVRPARGRRPELYEIEQLPELFRPECLTIAVTGRCSLDCSYCFGRSDEWAPRWPGEAAVRASARWTAGCAHEQGRPLVVGLHGSAEPLHDVARVRKVVAWVAEEVASTGAEMRLGVTTSGVVDDEALDWAARVVDSVTVSVDGPPEVHDRHRRDRTGDATWARVDRALQRLVTRRRPKHLALRMTMTSHGLPTMARDIEWLGERYRPDVIVVNPVYLSTADAVAANGFSSQLAAGRRRLRGTKVQVVFPGSRPGVRHGPFCPPLQGNLLLTPSGQAAWCFAEMEDGALSIGGYDAATDRFEIDQARFRELLTAASRPPVRCLECACATHCSRGCPDSCALRSQPSAGFCDLVQADLRERLVDALDRPGDGP